MQARRRVMLQRFARAAEVTMKPFVRFWNRRGGRGGRSKTGSGDRAAQLRKEQYRSGRRGAPLLRLLGMKPKHPPPRPPDRPESGRNKGEARQFQP